MNSAMNIRNAVVSLFETGQRPEGLQRGTSAVVAAGGAGAPAPRGRTTADSDDEAWVLDGDEDSESETDAVRAADVIYGKDEESDERAGTCNLCS